MKCFSYRFFVIGLFAFLASFPLVKPVSVLADAGQEAVVASAPAKQEAASAQTSEDLLSKVGQLSKRVEELEAKLAEKAAPAAESDRLKLLEDRLSAQEKIASTGTGGGINLDSLPAGQFLKNTKISGFVDTSYTFNFNQPSTLINNDNRTGANVHPFDRSSNDFTLHMVQLNLEQEAAPIGYKVSLDWGEDSEVIGSAGLGSTTDEFDLENAYLTYKLPMDKVCERWKCLDGVTGNIMAGKFVTMAGAEVIESKDNWNFSRSILFSSAIPFTHVGVRSNWNYKGWLDFAAGVNNGWDVADDNNQAKSLEFRLGVTPSPWGIDWVSSGLVYLFGSEKANKSGDHRHLLDLVTTVKNPLKGNKDFDSVNPYLDKLTLMFNMDWAQEQNGVRFDQGGVRSLSQETQNPPLLGDSLARWHGYAVYGKYELFPWWTLSNRLEWFSDTDGARTFIQSELWEYTFTNQFNLFKNLITRLEYRHDGADKEAFATAQTASQNLHRSWQDIVYLEAIVTF